MDVSDRTARPPQAAPPPPFPTSAGAVLWDDTTRNLCAAVHVDADFCDAVIREYLTEPRRAIPVSPGIDAAAVLREAVAARTRRRIRDAVLLAVLVVVFFLSSSLLIGWLLLGAAIRLGVAVYRKEPLRRLATGLLAVLVVCVVGSSVFAGLAGSTEDRMSSGPPSPSDDGDPFAAAFAEAASTDAPADLTVLTVTLAALGLLVIGMDRLAVMLLRNRSFQRVRFTPHPAASTWPGERWVRTVSAGNYHQALSRVANTDATSNLVVYRGYEPFVGAGIRLAPISMALTLKDENGAPPGARFTLGELYDHVAVDVLAMRGSASLSPSGRLARIEDREQILVAAKEVLINYGDPATRIVLPHLAGPPQQKVSGAAVAAVIEKPYEWMRYYRCFRVETWNLNVTISGYLHFGLGDGQLYVEWTPCVLTPIAEHFRLEDRTPSVKWGRLLRTTIGDWVRLPATLLPRTGDLFRRIRPEPESKYLARPDSYGTAASIREIAAADDTESYFQDSDVVRYVELLTRRVLISIQEFLEEKNISVTEFAERAANIINNFGANYGVNNYGPNYGTNHVDGPRGNPHRKPASASSPRPPVGKP